MQAAPAVAPETPAPTGTVLAPTIRLYRLEEGTACPPPTASGPLLLLLPWLGARPRAIARYVALYQQRGMDVLVAETTLCHFLWPRQGLAYAGRVLALLEETPALGARPLLVHALSAGAYAFAQMLVHLSRAPERHGQLAARVRGLVYDSLVTGDLANAALGVAQATGARGLRPAVAVGTLLYLGLCRSCTQRYYAAAQAAFARPPLRCPVLLFHGCDDRLCDPTGLRALLEAWRGAGIPVHVQAWQQSVHAGHLRRHPEEYRAALTAFLVQLNLGLP